MPASSLQPKHKRVAALVAIVGDRSYVWDWKNRRSKNLSSSNFCSKTWVLNVEEVLVLVLWAKSAEAVLHLVQRPVGCSEVFDVRMTFDFLPARRCQVLVKHEHDLVEGGHDSVALLEFEDGLHGLRIVDNLETVLCILTNQVWPLQFLV